MLEPKDNTIVLSNSRVKNFGEKFQGLVASLSKVFTHSRAIISKYKLPEYMIMERVLVLSILDKKSSDYTSVDKVVASQQLRQPLEKYRKEVAERMKITEQEVERAEMTLDQYLTNLNKVNNSKPVIDEYMYNLVQVICQRKPEKSFFGGIKEVVYSKKDLEQLGKAFKVNINFMNYEKDDKNLTKEFENPNEDEIYILIAKGLYYLLYSKNRRNLSKIEVVENNPVDMQVIEKIFSKSSSSIISDSQQQKDIQEQGSTILFPHDISCANCARKCPEFDCLFWNYQYLCGECVMDISVDTSHIPGPRILKYCQERDLSYKKYEKMCPQCTGITAIKNYNPTKKPKKFICDVCRKTVCIEHSCNIYQCFCYCAKCDLQTLYIPSMQLNFCQKCRFKHCFNCGSNSKQFCKCICERCLKENQAHHNCQPSCHYCLNSPSKMKTCECGLMICYGCFYHFLNDNGNYDCRISEYS